MKRRTGKRDPNEVFVVVAPTTTIGTAERLMPGDLLHHDDPRTIAGAATRFTVPAIPDVVGGSVLVAVSDAVLASGAHIAAGDTRRIDDPTAFGHPAFVEVRIPSPDSLPRVPRKEP